MILAATQLMMRSKRRFLLIFVASLLATDALSQVNFVGLGYGYTGPQGIWGTVGLQPPDANLAVGPNHVVQVINLFYAVWSKSGTPLLGPRFTSTLFAGFTGACANTNGIDPTVNYDRMANRWVFLTFAADPNANWYSCLAVSASGDPLGTYYRYQFPAAGEPDYQKLAVWPDAYYGTANIIIGTNGALSPTACAYERAAMLNGQPARQICFATSSASGISLLPSDLDGATLPPTGSANYLLNLDPSLNGPLGFWKFHVDWSNPANSSLIMQPAVTGAPFSVFSCLDMSGVPQSSMSKLDVLGDRLLYRLAYRNFGDHESLLATHNVCGSGSNVGERWYELRNPGTGISVYQQGTYSPTDGNDRWMGSGVMDQAGDVAVGFSIGSLSKPVSVHYATHLSSDPLGVMTAENSIVDSAQFAPWSGVVGENLRWGDYTSMRIDPSDDCTMWYSNEYFLPGNSINPTTWSTRIGSFRLSNCGAVTSPPPPPCTHAHKGCRQ